MRGPSQTGLELDSAVKSLSADPTWMDYLPGLGLEPPTRDWTELLIPDRSLTRARTSNDHETSTSRFRGLQESAVLVT